MKYLKKFNESKDLYESIAKDVYNDVLKLSKDGSISFSDFEDFMKGRNSSTHTIDGVASYLVDMGINFN
jgi:hypothetical protein